MKTLVRELKKKIKIKLKIENYFKLRLKIVQGKLEEKINGKFKIISKVNFNKSFHPGSCESPVAVAQEPNGLHQYGASILRAEH